MDRDLSMNKTLILTLPLLLLALQAEALDTGLKDPTRPYAWQEVKPVVEIPHEVMEWRVTAVRIGRDSRSAIVNGQLVHVGESLGEARVAAIDAREVVLDYQGNKVTVGLLRPEIKRPSGRLNNKRHGSGDQN